MTTIDPPMTELSEPFWEATRERRLLVQRCTSCDGWSWTPRPRCAHCWRADLVWTEPPGTPHLYSWALQRGRGDNSDRMVALIDVAPGLRIVSNLVDSDVAPDEWQIDERLELVWLELEDGRALPQFRRARPPAEAGS